MLRFLNIMLSIPNAPPPRKQEEQQAQRAINKARNATSCSIIISTRADSTEAMTERHLSNRSGSTNSMQHRMLAAPKGVNSINPSKDASPALFRLKMQMPPILVNLIGKALEITNRQQGCRNTHQWHNESTVGNEKRVCTAPSMPHCSRHRTRK